MSDNKNSCNNDNAIKLSIANVIKGLTLKGHAKEGTGHFIKQRLTAVILIPLIFFLIVGIGSLVNAHNIDDVRGLFSNPFYFIGILVFVIIGFYHGTIGVGVIIDDYISDVSTNKNLKHVTAVLAGCFALLFIISIFKIVF